jgi:hypothetical protein
MLLLILVLLLLRRRRRVLRVFPLGTRGRHGDFWNGVDRCAGAIPSWRISLMFGIACAVVVLYVALIVVRCLVISWGQWRF